MKKSKNIYIRLNGEMIYCNCPGELLAKLLARNDLKYWNERALLKFYKEVYKLVIIYAKIENERKRQASLTRFINKSEKYLYFYEMKQRSKEEILDNIFSTILNCEKLYVNAR